MAFRIGKIILTSDQVQGQTVVFNWHWHSDLSFVSVSSPNVFGIFFIIWHSIVITGVLLFFSIQEIKFEPNIMCEPIDKKLTFRACQVSALYSDMQ